MAAGIRVTPYVSFLPLAALVLAALLAPSGASAAEEFTSPPNPSAGILRGTGDGFAGDGIKPDTPVGSRVPPARDYSQSIKRRQPFNPDVQHTDITNRADRGALNSPNR